MTADYHTMMNRLPVLVWEIDRCAEQKKPDERERYLDELVAREQRILSELKAREAVLEQWKELHEAYLRTERRLDTAEPVTKDTT